MIEKTISHYIVTEELGRGGMGVVYRAEDTRLKRTVALKFLPPHALSSPEERDRFTREAQAAASLSHPAIATVFEIDERDGQRFIAMEYIDGKSLKQKLEAGPMKIPEALDVAAQIAEGLRAAHEHGVIHRDMKSANVMVTEKGQVKIMDFGLAKLKGVSLLTKQGTTLGTVSYMSPEQARGEKVDPRTDIWSLGVILYEMVTGRLPFEGDFEQSILYAIMNSDPEPATGVRANVPVELDRILTKMLAKDPADRYQNVQEIPVDLRAVKSGLRSGSSGTTRVSIPAARVAAPTRPTQSSLLPWVVAALMAVVAVLAVWAPWRSPRAQAGETRFSMAVPSGELLNIVAYRAVAISPDGRRVVYRASSALYLRDMENPEPRMVPGTEHASSPFFSPDGRWLAFFAEGKLKKVALSGGAPVTLAEAPDNRGGTWSRDGTIVFSASTTEGLSRVSESGGPVEALTVRDTSRMERTHRWPSIFPDGKAVAYTVGSMDSPDYYDDATIEVLNVESGERKTVVQGASTAHFALPGYLLYSRAGVLFAVEFDAGSLAVRSAPVPVLEGVIGDPTSGAMNYAVSEDGVLAYIPGDVEGGERSLVLLDMEGNATPYPAPPGGYAEPRMSRDGNRICLVIGAGKDYDIWVYDILRGTLSRLTFGGTNRTPNWSPDGKYIAYWSNEGVAVNSIYRKAADGSGAAEKLYGGPDRTYIDAWSRDGSVMVLDQVSGQGQASNIAVLTLTGEPSMTTFLATDFDEWQSSLSPDGRWLAYISNESGNYQVYVVPFPARGGKWQISTAGGFEPHWAPDGSKLYYQNAGQMMVVDVETRPSFSASQPRVLFNGYHPLLMDSGMSYDITPDGRHILTTRSSREELLQNVNIVVNWVGSLEQLFTGRD